MALNILVLCDTLSVRSVCASPIGERSDIEVLAVHVDSAFAEYLCDSLFKPLYCLGIS